MLGFYLKAAWRNALRTPLHSALNLLGLSLGLATFILVMLFTHEEMTYYSYFANHADLYMIRMGSEIYGSKAVTMPEPADSVAQLKLDFPGIDGIARAAGTEEEVVNGEQVISNQSVLIVDPSYIDVVGVPLLRGDPHSALSAPDSVAISESLARELFGTLDCLGRTFSLSDRETVRITAIYREMEQQNDARIILSGAGENSVLSRMDKQDSAHVLPFTYIASYLLIRSPDVRARIEAGLEDFAHRHYQFYIDGMKAYFVLMPLDAWRLQGKKYGDIDAHPLIRLLAVDAVGLLVLAVATLNYINLATALAGRRGVEMGVRKAIGASRGQIIQHLLAESVALTGVSTLVAMALAELVLPVFNTLMFVHLSVEYLHQPGLLLALAGFAVVFGLLAGAYPALVLSAGRPAESLRLGRQAEGRGLLRQAMVLLQYAISIAMIVGAVVIYRQYHYAANDIDGVDNNLVYQIDDYGAGPNVFPARLLDLVSALPGVAMVGALGTGDDWYFHRPDQVIAGSAKIMNTPVGLHFFEAWGLKPRSGRLFDGDHTDTDMIVLNQSAVGAFGFASPEAALGQEIVAEMPDGSRPTRRLTVVGIVPDFMVETIYGRIPPRVFIVTPPSDYSLLMVKLTGRDVPDTIAAIKRAERAVSGHVVYHDGFMDALLNTRYLDMLRDAESIGGFSLLSIFVAALGLFSLAEFMAQRRTKEIGIRKAMGASSAQIAALLSRDLLMPAIAANLIAWPLAYFGATWWLSGFAYHTTVPLWLLPAASVLVLLVAGLAVLLQVMRVAWAKPATALRYE